MQPYINDPPEFETLCIGFYRIEPFVDFSVMSEQQKWIIYLIVEKNFTREQVRQAWFNHFQRNITVQALQNVHLLHLIQVLQCVQLLHL